MSYHVLGVGIASTSVDEGSVVARRRHTVAPSSPTSVAWTARHGAPRTVRVSLIEPPRGVDGDMHATWRDWLLVLPWARMSPPPCATAPLPQVTIALVVEVFVVDEETGSHFGHPGPGSPRGPARQSQARAKCAWCLALFREQSGENIVA